MNNNIVRIINLTFFNGSQNEYLENLIVWFTKSEMGRIIVYWNIGSGEALTVALRCECSDDLKFAFCS